MEKLNLTLEWDKNFPQSDKVNHSKVTFHNRYGITLAVLPAGSPDAQAALAEHLTDKDFLSELRGEYAMFYGGYAEDRSFCF